MLNVAKVAKLLGVHPDTVRSMSEDKLPFHRTDGGHRRYTEADVNKLLGIQVEKANELCVVVYSRVSSQDQKQKGDLDRQKLRNIEYCITQGYTIIQTFEECASGMNDNRPKLKALIELAKTGVYSKLIVEHKDRLVRFNFNMYAFFLKQLGVEVICIEQSLPKTFEAELVEDMLALIATFSAKIYGKRSHKNKKKGADVDESRNNNPST